MMGAPSWEDWQIETLLSMWEKGASGSLIAREIGKSRSAVLGKVIRLRAEGYKIDARTTSPTGDMRKRRPRKAAGAHKKRQTPATAPVPAIRPKPVIASDPVPFIERNANQCAFPLWEADDDHRNCCGAPIDPFDETVGRLGRSYCEAHREVAFRSQSQVRRERRSAEYMRSKRKAKTRLSGLQIRSGIAG